MGNQLTTQKIIENLHEFQPDLQLYQLVQQNTLSQNKNLNIWQHKFISDMLIQKNYLVRSWNQLNQLLEAFSFRYNNKYIVASKYLTVQNHQSIKNLSNPNSFPQSNVRIFYENSLTNLSHFKQIPQHDGAYFLLQSLKGFGLLVNKLKFPFEIRQEMFHITANRQLKIWISQDVTDLSLLNQLRPLKSQNQMIKQILQTIKSNIYFTTQSQKLIQTKDFNLPPILIEELLKRNYQNFDQVIESAENYLDSYEVKIGTYMSCLKDLSNQELINIMNSKQNHPNTLQDQIPFNQNSRLFKNNTSQVSFHNANLTNNYSNHNSAIQFQRNLSMGQLTNYNSNGSQVYDSRTNSVKNSRSKSNKRSGISLVKKQQKNHQSLIIVKQQRPVTSHVNYTYQSPVKNKPQSSKLPPRSSSIKKVNFNIPQQKQNITPFNHIDRNLKFSSPNSRGISITKKQQVQQKSPFKQLNPQSPFSRTKNHYNTNFSGSINCSTVSIGPLPTPKYYNDSRAKTTLLEGQNFNVNFSTVSRFQTNFVPNQSLTRFQKENITFNNPNASVTHYYEVPRIYVHSPKAQGKILRMDSMSTQEDSGQKPMIHNQQNLKKEHKLIIKRQSDFVKQPQQICSEVFYYPDKNKNKSQKDLKFQTPSNKNKTNKQFDSYIEQNKQVFTHPKLYEYITNNKSQNYQLKKQGTFKRNQQKKDTYIDYLANAQISQSLDYNTADKLFSLGSNKLIKSPTKNKEKQSPHNFTLNDFPTIQQIQQPPHSYDDGKQRQENTSFLPVQLNLASNQNLGSRNQLSTVRRGQQQSLVVEYKKFYDDTNRSNNSPNKNYFSPLKKSPTQLIHPSNFESNMAKKYSTAQNWQASPPKPAKLQTKFNNVLFPISENAHQPMIVISKPNNNSRQSSLSPVSKVIFNGNKQPAINPLILQDMQRIRQNKIF